MEIKPLFNRIVVKQIEESHTTESGIMLPEMNSRVIRGKVVAVSVDNLLNVKVGETVLFDKRFGVEFELDNETLLMVNVNDLIGVIEE